MLLPSSCNPSPLRACTHRHTEFATRGSLSGCPKRTHQGSVSGAVRGHPSGQNLTFSPARPSARYIGRLEHAFAETAKGNGRPFIDMLADDVEWEIIGSTDWSRTFHGKPSVTPTYFARLASSLMALIRLRRPAS